LPFWHGADRPQQARYDAMRILILGGSGMLGHALLQAFAPRHDVRATLHQPLERYQQWPLFDSTRAFAGIDVCAPAALAGVLAQFRPEAVVNCVGLVKQRPKGQEALANLEINAAAPHRIALLCRDAGARLIHVSTDCVFSGRKGLYTEADQGDAEDVYGRAKFLGELHEPHCLTLRTSFVGRELAGKLGLLEWFLAQRGPIKGYRRAIFSGLTTLELARIIDMLLTRFPRANGLYHVSSEPIDKYALLKLFQEHFRQPVAIEADDSVVVDRSLDSSRFRRDFDYRPPDWPAMVKEL
jgi:dTDP-4-dehydrorhamnose reductase